MLHSVYIQFEIANRDKHALHATSPENALARYDFRMRKRPQVPAFVGNITTVSICFNRLKGWLGSRVVSVLDSGAEGPGFKSQSRRCPVTVLGKLFTPIAPLFTKQQNW